MLACFREEIRTLGVRDTAVRCYTLHLSVLLPQRDDKGGKRKERDKTVLMMMATKMNWEQMISPICCWNSSLESYCWDAFWMCPLKWLFADKAWMNGEEPARLEFAGKMQ